MKRRKCKKAHGKGKMHGKGAFAVQPHIAHGKGGDTAMPLPCVPLCRELFAVFAVQRLFAVRCAQSLPCAALCRAFC